MPDGACVSGDMWLNPGLQTFAVTGGTGVYAGAYGSGTLVRSLGALNSNGQRTGTETWTGTLEVPGLDFDLTPPTLTGATNKSVKAKKGAKSARVAFRVTAQDDRDGSVPVTCSPKSGSRFPLGRTRVSCSTTDTSANTASATFTVTVKKTRQFVSNSAWQRGHSIRIGRSSPSEGFGTVVAGAEPPRARVR